MDERDLELTTDFDDDDEIIVPVTRKAAEPAEEEWVTAAEAARLVHRNSSWAHRVANRNPGRIKKRVLPGGAGNVVFLKSGILAYDKFVRDRDERARAAVSKLSDAIDAKRGVTPPPKPKTAWYPGKPGPRPKTGAPSTVVASKAPAPPKPSPEYVAALEHFTAVEKPSTLVVPREPTIIRTMRYVLTALEEIPRDEQLRVLEAARILVGAP